MEQASPEPEPPVVNFSALPALLRSPSKRCHARLLGFQGSAHRPNYCPHTLTLTGSSSTSSFLAVSSSVRFDRETVEETPAFLVFSAKSTESSRKVSEQERTVQGGRCGESGKFGHRMNKTYLYIACLATVWFESAVSFASVPTFGVRIENRAAFQSLRLRGLLAPTILRTHKMVLFNVDKCKISLKAHSETESLPSVVGAPLQRGAAKCVIRNPRSYVITLEHPVLFARFYTHVSSLIRERT